MLCLFPNEQKAFFVAVNTDSETADYESFEAALIRSLNLATPARPPPAAPSPQLADWDGIYTPAPSRFEAYALLDALFGFVRVSWTGSHLRLTTLQAGSKELLPVGGLLFRAADRVSASHALLGSREGQKILSTGSQSYARTPMAKLIALWLAAIGGALGFVLILGLGLWRLARRQLSRSDPILAPFLASAALVASIPLFALQPFLAIGDATLASVWLAAASALLPFAALAGLVMQGRRRKLDGLAIVAVMAMLGILQWTVVLAAWHLWPVVLWL
jgi:hypothetical protein